MDSTERASKMEDFYKVKDEKKMEFIEDPCYLTNI